MSEDYRDAIDEVMDNFDFHKVERVMTALGWLWARHGGNEMYQPDVSELRTRARQLMRHAVEEMLARGEKKWGTETGGFRVECWHEDGRIDLRLDFIVETWNNFE